MFYGHRDNSKFVPLFLFPVLTIHRTDEELGAAFTIWAQEGLDREDEPFYDFSVTCHLTPNETLRRGSFNKTSITIPGQLAILDQNDSPIVTQEGEKLVRVHVTLSNDKFIAGSRVTPDGNHGDMIAHDSDTVDVNRITMASVNDTKGLLEYALKTTVFNVKHLNNSRDINATMTYPLISKSTCLILVNSVAFNDKHSLRLCLVNDAYFIQNSPTMSPQLTDGMEIIVLLQI